MWLGADSPDKLCVAGLNEFPGATLLGRMVILEFFAAGGSQGNRETEQSS
jgi:hypothetical protein